MKSTPATLEKRVKGIEINIHEEIWKFIIGTLKQELSNLLDERSRPDVDIGISCLLLQGMSIRDSMEYLDLKDTY